MLKAAKEKIDCFQQRLLPFGVAIVFFGRTLSSTIPNDSLLSLLLASVAVTRGEPIDAIGVLGVKEGICFASPPVFKMLFDGVELLGVNVGGFELFMLIRLLGVGVNGGTESPRLNGFDSVGEGVLTTVLAIFSVVVVVDVAEDVVAGEAVTGSVFGSSLGSLRGGGVGDFAVADAGFIAGFKSGTLPFGNTEVEDSFGLVSFACSEETENGSFLIVVLLIDSGGFLFVKGVIFGGGLLACAVLG